MTTLKAISFILGITLTISMVFVWPTYYLVVMAYLVIRLIIALVRKEKNWTVGAVLFTVLTGPFSGLIELIEQHEINEYINWVIRKELE